MKIPFGWGVGDVALCDMLDLCQAGVSRAPCVGRVASQLTTEPPEKSPQYTTQSYR